MAADQDGQGRLTGVARRHLKLVCSLAALATVIGVAAGLLLPASAKATATVLISPLDGNPYSTNGRGDDLTNLQSEATLVRADAVEQVVRQKLSSADRSRVSVTVPPNTQVLLITYTANSATAARDGAQAFATGYLTYRSQRAQSVLNDRSVKLREQEKKVQEELSNATKRLAAATVGQKSFLRQRITAYNNQLGVIDEQNNDIAATPVNPGSVITPAQPPSAIADDARRGVRRRGTRGRPVRRSAPRPRPRTLRPAPARRAHGPAPRRPGAQHGVLFRRPGAGRRRRRAGPARRTGGSEPRSSPPCRSVRSPCW